METDTDMLEISISDFKKAAMNAKASGKAFVE